MLVLTGTSGFAAGNPSSSPDVLDAASVLSPQARAVLYALVFLLLCAVSFATPDAPLLAYIFSMPIAQFSGFRVAITILQCAVVLLKMKSPRSWVPSAALSTFLLCMVASAGWALYPRESLFSESTGVTTMIGHLPLLIAARSLLSSHLTTGTRLLWTLTCGCVPGCILTIRNALSGITYLAEGQEYYMGLIPPDIFSPMLVMSGLFLMACLTSPSGKMSTRCFAVTLLPLICLALLLSGIRSGWLAFGVGGICLLLRRRSFVVVSAVFATMAVVGVLGFTSAMRLNLADKLESRLSERSMGTFHTRLLYWEIAGEGLMTRPVLGIGWGSFPGFAADSRTGTEVVSHNIFMRVLCELGIVGFVVFAFWILATLARLRHRPEGGLIGLLMIGVLVQGLFLDQFVCSYFWLFLGMCDGVAGTGPLHAMERLKVCDHTLAGVMNQPLA